MSKQAQREAALIRRIRSLSPEKMAEVEDFIEFLSQREDKRLTRASGTMAQAALRKVWNNAADAAYDRL